MPAIHPTETPSAADDALYQAHIAERYGRPVHEILWEETRRPLPELLKERHRRSPRPVPLHHREPQPDPDAEAHRAALLEAVTPRRRGAA
ncbi:hypothetical protein [Streptomyces aureocirculatus]|uniref:hypothetical protein n=1 Tax=Streptomyces aureocirculatus TaxID=67275 RepID=UPI000AF52E8C|nr:hypothetical protein [Streptomyces aureocirculatus]